jgi:hypothetical protein
MSDHDHGRNNDRNRAVFFIRLMAGGIRREEDPA